MTKKFKTAIGSVVVFTANFTLREGESNKPFKFTLTATRKTQDELDAQPEKTVKEVLFENVTDWKDQRLVLLENNEPAPYSRDAMEFIAAQYPSVLGLFWAAYQRECGCKEKN